MRPASCSSASPRLGAETAGSASGASITTGSITSTSAAGRHRVLASVALALALLACDGSSAGTTRSGADTLFADDFESGTLAAWQDGVDSTRQRVVTDPGLAQSG